MLVKTTAPGSVQPVSLPCRPDDFEVTGDVVAYLAPVVPLSRDDLVSALLLTHLTTDQVAALSDADVRHEVGLTLAADGVNAIHETTFHERSVTYTASEARHIELCHQRIASAFGLSAPAVTVRSRVSDRSVGSRRVLVRAA